MSDKKDPLPKITKDMSIDEIVKKYPETVEVFFKFGVHCLGCVAASFETLEQGASVHGIDIDAMVKEMNDILKSDSKVESDKE